MAAVFNRPLVINQGATFREPWTWSTGTPPVLVNLTGCTARMQLRPDVDSLTLYHEMTTENGGITIDGTAGTIVLFISDADTTNFGWTTAVYDLEIQFSNSTVVRLGSGSITLSKEVTQ